MTAFTFDPSVFRVAYPAFANETAYPDARLEQYWIEASCYITNDDSICWLAGDCRKLALNLLTAHLLQISNFSNELQVTGEVSSATVDKVSTTFQIPQHADEFNSWLGQTEYGKKLLALLQVNATGGVYFKGCSALWSY